MLCKSFFVCFSILSFIFSLDAQEKSDREKSGLAGYVKSVKGETAEIVIKNGKTIEKKRELDSIETFDVSGKQITYFAYTDDEKVLFGETLIYDAQEKLIEKRTQHSEFLNLCDKKTFVYNEKEQLTEEICSLANGQLAGKRIYHYDADGRLVEEESLPMEEKSKYLNKYVTRYKYDENGKRIERSTLKVENGEWKPEDFKVGFYKQIYFYNPQGKVSIENRINSNEALYRVFATNYDGQGNELESVEYDADGKVKNRIRYSYDESDKQGNCIKETEYEWITKDGKTLFQPSEITYRKIRYFSKKQIKEFEAK